MSTLFMTTRINCATCKFFIKDTIGTGDGLGRCGKLEEFKAKNPSKLALKRALFALGCDSNKGPIFWGGQGDDRNCSKYEFA